MNAISMQNFKKDYGAFAVEIPRLELQQGYVTGLVGKNGSGKTTLIRSALGMIPKTAGAIQVLGGDLSADAALREQVGFVSETPCYISTLTVENVHEMVRPFYPQWDEALYQQLRAEFELPDRKIKELSKGQQKILSFLMAFCCRPRLLILDEPTANLDPAVRHRLLGYLRRYMEEEGNTILYSTHITADLEDICDYLVGLDHGVLAFQGEKDEVLDAFRVVQGPSELLTAETRELFLGWEQSALGFTALTDRPAEAEVLLGQEARYRHPTIEDLSISRGGTVQ